MPAKSKSRRLPNKNKIYFYGEPMVVRAVNTLNDSGMVDNVVVSTDDDTIIRLVKDLPNVTIHRRGKELCSDTATVNDVIFDYLTTALISGGYFCCLYPCSPLITPEDIVKSYNLMDDYQADGCCSSADYHVNPAYAFEIQSNRVVPLFDAEKRRELSRVVKSHDSGNIYWRKTNTFLKDRELMCDNMVAYQLPRERAVDIDTMEDLKLAEYYYGRR